MLSEVTMSRVQLALNVGDLEAAIESSRLEEQTTCCYAVQDKIWVKDPGGAPWEIYTVLADAGTDGGCGCGPAAAEDEACCSDPSS